MTPQTCQCFIHLVTLKRVRLHMNEGHHVVKKITLDRLSFRRGDVQVGFLASQIYKRVH